MATERARLDPRALFRDLLVEDYLASPRIGWWERSHRDPIAFFTALFGALAPRVRRHPKSAPFEAYDLYHDAVVSHLGGQAVALRAFDPVRGWRSFTYEDLDQGAAARAQAWRAHGLEAGQSVCCVGGMGPGLAFDLLAALRLGCVVTVLEPSGTRFLTRRLDALAPDHVAADAVVGPALGEHAAALLPAVGLPQAGGLPGAVPPSAGTEEATSFAYPAGAVAARLFSPLRDPSGEPVDVTADTLYLGALRDGLMTFGLEPGAAFAWPGASLMQSQPALLLAALLVGATYVHLDPEDLCAAPDALAELGVTVLGVSPPLVALLEEAGRLRWRTPPQRWVRSPQEAGDLLRWQRFADDTRLAKVPSACVLVDATFGGAVLSATYRHRFVTQMVRPAPGLAWQLLDVTGARPASGPAGVLAPIAGSLGPVEEETPPWGALLLVRWHEDWTYVGTQSPRRRGAVYPVEEVLDAAADLPFSEGSFVAVVPSAESSDPHRFELAVFCGAARRADLARDGDAWRREAVAAIGRRVGAAYLPDRVAFFARSPRLSADGDLDRAWGQAQYVTGRLHQKERSGAFRELAELREAARVAARAVPEPLEAG